MPLPDLVSEMRAALSSMYDEGMKMEKQWLDYSLHRRPPSSGPRRSEPLRHNMSCTPAETLRGALRMSKTGTP